MEKQRRHIDDLFRERLYPYEEREDGTVWAQLKDRLLEHKYGKRPPIWRWVALMLVFTTFSTFCLTGENSAVTVAASEKANTPTTNTQEQKTGSNTHQKHKRLNKAVAATGKETPALSSTSATPAGTNPDDSYTAHEAYIDSFASLAAQTTVELGYQSLLALLDGSQFHTLSIANRPQEIKPRSQAGLLQLNTPEANLASIESNTGFRPLAQLSTPSQPTHLADLSRRPSYWRASEKDIFWAAKYAVAPERNVRTLPEVIEPGASTVQTPATLGVDMSSKTPGNPHRYLDEIGISASAGSRFSQNGSTELEASVYLKKHLNKKLSISLQPGVQFHKYKNVELASNSYYSITSNTVDSFSWLSVAAKWQPSTNYVFNQKYDSIVVSTQMTRSNWEFALPVLLSYNLTDKLSLGGGPVLFIGRDLLPEENVRVYKHEITDSVMERTNPLSSTETQNHFVHTVPEYGQAPLFSTNRKVNFRAGYLLSLSWMLDSKWHLSLNAQQTVLGLRAVPNSAMRNTFGAPVIRIGLGWRLY